MALAHDIPALDMPALDMSALDLPARDAPIVSEATPADYFALLKPRVMRLVVFTALVGLLAAPVAIGWLQGTIALLCIAVGAGASGALNMWWDADIDAVMSRTRARPVPGGRVTGTEALVFGLVLSAFSVVTLGLLVNWSSAALLAFTILFYAVVYSMWLKRSTPQNIVIGGAAGAFPPMVGWMAATGSLAWEPIAMFAIIFLWTPPHFWALALFKRLDYSEAGVPMLPVVAGVRATQHQILVYAIVLALAALAPIAFATGPTFGALYALVAVPANAWFVLRAVAVWRMDPDDAAMVPAKRLFLFSLLYLFVLFAALGVEAMLWRATGSFVAIESFVGLESFVAPGTFAGLGA